MVLPGNCDKPSSTAHRRGPGSALLGFCAPCPGLTARVRCVQGQLRDRRAGVQDRPEQEAARDAVGAGQAA
eukprot:3055407-Rhodomonas_salina.5